jgi:hypothetical protein
MARSNRRRRDLQSSAQLLCDAQELGESQICDAVSGQRPMPSFFQLSVKYDIFALWQLGMKLEWLILTPSTPSFANQSSDF